MRYMLSINQVKMLEWGLNLAQASVFSVLNEANSWARSAVFDGETYYWFSKLKLIKELPSVTDKPDTIKRHLSALEKAGLIRRKVIVDGNNTYHYVAITAKGKQWNAAPSSCDSIKSEGGKNFPREKSYPKQLGKNFPREGEKSQNHGKNIPTPREKFPCNTITSNPITNDPKDLLSDSIESNEPDHVLDFNLDQTLPEKFDANAKHDLLTEAFDYFWNAYQHKTNRKAAEKSFLKISLPRDRDTARRFLQGVIDQAQAWGNVFHTAPDNQKQFQPNPATWINNERWNDEQLPVVRQTLPVNNMPHFSSSPCTSRRDQVNDSLTNIQDTNW